MENNIKVDHIDKYIEKIYGDSRIYHGFKAFIPVICVNGPIYNIEFDSNLNVTEFIEKPFLPTQIRKKGWPGKSYVSILLHTPEVAVILTNPKGLYQVLEIGYAWHNNIKQLLKTSSENIIRRAPIETAFIKKAVKHFRNKQGLEPYRSDLDVINWF